MTIQTLVPNGLNLEYGVWTPTGDPTEWEALSDSSDGSYAMRAAASGEEILYLNMTSYTIPAGSRVKRVRAKVRMSRPASANCGIAVNGPDLTNLGGVTYFTGSSGGTVWVYGPWLTVNRAGTEWVQADLDALVVSVREKATTTGARTTFYEAHIEVDLTADPTTSSVTPNSSWTASTSPTVAWVYSDVDGDPQTKYQVRIFTAAQYGIGGFDPATSPATWDSGEVSSSAASVVCGAALVNGTTYRAYVRTGHALNTTTQWSAWAFGQFVMTIFPPPPPLLTATWDAANNRNVVTVRGRINELSANSAGAEVALGSWVSDANATGLVRDSFAGGAEGSWATFYQSVAAGAARVRSGSLGSAAPGAVRSAVASLFPFGTTLQARVGIKWTGPGTISWGAQSAMTPGVWKEYKADSLVAPAATTGWEMVVEITATAPGDAVWFDKAAAHANGPAFYSAGGMSESGQVYSVLKQDPETGAFAFVANDAALVGEQSLTLYDYTAERPVPGGSLAPTYYSWIKNTLGSTVLQSEFVVLVGAANTNDGLWWIKDPAIPANNVGGVRVSVGDDGQADESLGVFRPLGRKKAVTVGGDVTGWDGSYQITTLSAAERTAMEKLVKTQTPLLVQDPFGDQKWIRIVSRSYVRPAGSVPSQPVTIWQVGYVEVDAP